jgi:hypothetical protein
MLGIFLDAAVLMGILYLLLQDQAPDFLQVLLVSVGMAVANLACALLLGHAIGLFVIIPIVLIDGFILMLYCHLTLQQAAIALALLIAWQIGLHFLLAAMFSHPATA